MGGREEEREGGREEEIDSDSDNSVGQARLRPFGRQRQVTNAV